MSEPRTHWTDRTEPIFTEVAEVFGINTDMVMAAVQDPEEPGIVRVLVTPVQETDVVSAVLRRDDAGVLQLVSSRKEPDFLEKMQERIRRLGEEQL